MELGKRCGRGDEPFAFALEPFQAARGSDDVEDVLDFHEEVGHKNGRRQVLCQSNQVESAVVVLLLWAEQEQVGRRSGAAAANC